MSKDKFKVIIIGEIRIEEDICANDFILLHCSYATHRECGNGLTVLVDCVDNDIYLFHQSSD